MSKTYSGSKLRKTLLRKAIIYSNKNIYQCNHLYIKKQPITQFMIKTWSFKNLYDRNKTETMDALINQIYNQLFTMK